MGQVGLACQQGVGFVVGPQSCCADAAFNDMLRDATKMRQMLYRQTSDKIKLQQSVVISQGLYPHLAALGLARKTPAAARQRARASVAGDGVLAGGSRRGSPADRAPADRPA